MSGPKRAGLLLGLVVAAALPRAWLALHAGIIEHDGAYYCGLAAAMLRGDWAHAWSTVWPPLYPAWIALAALPGSARGALAPEALETVARMVSVVAGTLSLVPLAVIARRALGERNAWIALVLAATHPRLIQYSASALTEATFILMLLSALALVLASDRDRRPGAESAAGAAFGLAYLARPEGVLIALSVWFVRALAGRAGGRRGTRVGASTRLQPWFLLGLVLAMLPYVVWTYGQLGHISLGEKGGYNLWRVHREAYETRFGEPAGLSERVFESPELADPAPRSRVELGRFVLEEPITLARVTLGQLGRILVSSVPAAAYLPWFLPAIVGLPLLMRRELWPIATVLVAIPLLYAPFSVDRRFFVPLVPLLMVTATAGLLTLGEVAGRRTAAIVVALLCAYGLGYAALRPLMDSAPEHRAAGIWLREEWPRLAVAGTQDSIGTIGPAKLSRPIVMSRKTWVGYYAGGLIAELPDGDLETLRERVRRKRADFLVVDERWAAPSRPWLAPLLDPESAPAGMTPLWHTETPKRLVLYDVRDWR